MDHLSESYSKDLQVLGRSFAADEAGVRLFLDALPMGVIIHRADGNIVYANDVARALLGQNSLVGMDGYTFVRQCQLRKLGTEASYLPERLPFMLALHGESACVEDLEVHRSDRRLALQAQATPVRDFQGQVNYAIATYQDITAQIRAEEYVNRYTEVLAQQVQQQTYALEQEILIRRQTEKALSRNQNQFQRFADTVPGVLFSLRVMPDRSVVCDYLNSWVEKIYDAPAAAVIRRPAAFFWSQMHPEDRCGFWKALTRCAQAHDTFQYEWRNLHPVDGVRYLKARAQPERHSNGEICWHGVLFDISDRKQAEIQRQQQANQTATVLKAIPDLILQINRNGDYIGHIRPKPDCDILTAEHCVPGLNIADYLPPALAAQHQQALQQALATDTPQVFEQTLTVAGRIQHEEVRVVPYGWDEVLFIIRDISDRKAAEQFLREQEAQHRQIINALPDLMFRISHDGYWLGYVQTNAQLDYLPTEYDPTGRHITEHMPQDVAERQLRAIEQALATKQVQVFEQTLNHDHRIQYEEVRIVPQGDDEVLFIVRDITDRKQAELALHRSEAENRAMLSAIPDLMFRLNRDGTYLSYFKKQQTLDLLEKTKDPVGHNIFDFAHDELLESHVQRQMQHVYEALDTGEVVIYEQTLYPEVGQQVYEEVRIVPCGAEEVLVMIQDIGDRKAAELALKQSEAQKRAMLKAIPDLMFHMRDDGLILEYMGGNNFADLFAEQDQVGHYLQDYATTANLTDHINQKMAAMQRALATGEMQLYEQTTRIGDVHQQEEVRVVPVHDGEVLVMIRDISDRKRIEAELRAANERLEKLSLTDSLTHLANRRSLDKHLHREWQRSLREQQPISFILFDLDYFKRFNDTYGHQQGDVCLQQVAQAALGLVQRSSDLIARYGGEEFAIVLTNTQLRGAYTIAQRLCATIQELQIPHASSEVASVVTASLGVSSVMPSADNQPNLLIRQADQALYAAKQAGRNNCQCFISR